MAIGQNASAGDFVVATSQLAEPSELLVVFDTALQKMNAYVFNPTLSQIELIQSPIPINSRPPQVGAPAVPGAAPDRQGRGR
jgi:hypothetical protein